MAEPSPTRADLGPGPAQAAAELCGWLAAGARAVALLAPAGTGRSHAFDAVAWAVAGRFAVERLAPKEGEAAESLVVRADAAARRATGGPALLLLEDGEVLSPAEARALRGLADHAPGDLRLAVGLAPTASSAEVLRALGPGLERVTLGGAPAARARPPAPSRRRATAAVLALAAGSIAASVALLVPRFRDAPPAAPAVSAPAAAAASAPGAAAERPAAPAAGGPEADLIAGKGPDLAPAHASAPPPRSLPEAGETRREGVGADRPAPARPTARPAPAAAGSAADVAARPQPLAPSREVAAPAPVRAAPAGGAGGNAAAARPAPGAPVRPPGGYLFVNAIPRALITVNGAPAGTTPVVRFPLARGQHRVVADFGDGRSEERRIDAVGAETYVVFGGTPR